MSFPAIATPAVYQNKNEHETRIFASLVSYDQSGKILFDGASILDLVSVSWAILAEWQLKVSSLSKCLGQWFLTFTNLRSTYATPQAFAEPQISTEPHKQKSTTHI